jgi:hypothetical protein
MTTVVPLVAGKLKSQGVALAAQLKKKLSIYQVQFCSGLEWSATFDGVHCGGFGYDYDLSRWIYVDAQGGRQLDCPVQWRQEVRRAVNEALEGMNAKTP